VIPSANTPTRGSVITYGVVGFSLATAGLLAVAGFCDIKLQHHGVAVASVTGLAFAGGIAAHFIRTAKHRALLA